MYAFYAELSLPEGFAVGAKEWQDRLVNGREVSMCSGFSLFKTLQGAPIRCWKCSIEAQLWIVEHHKNEVHRAKPVMNLFAVRKGKLVMMTRDHIIPKSLGGSNDVRNLRPGCSKCNEGRGNTLDLFDQAFMQDNPHLWSKKK